MAESGRLTEEVIDQIQDFAQAFPHFVQNKISLEGVSDLFTAKLHLRRYVQERDGVENSLKDATVLVLKLKEEHDKCKEQLQGFYQTTKALLPALDAGVSNQQGVGQLTAEFSQTLEQSVTKLKSSKCPILIAGETSSGKSSLLNLILGEEMLPTSTLSTTSIICELRYGEQRRAKVFTWDDHEIDVPLEDSSSDQRSLEKLSGFIHQKGDRDQETFPYKRAEIYLPLDFLKEGITIVDGPGVGESEKMDEVVFDYMEEAFAFIYVINSANAGGIQKDRLGRLLGVVSAKGREQLEVRKTKGNPNKDITAARFSHRAAIFVCNKWDQVPAHEAQTVQEEQLRVLRRYWHGCTEDQVFRLCTAEATKALQHGVVMKDFRHLLDGIERLIPISLQNKLQVYYSFLDQVLCRIKFMLDATIANAGSGTMTNEERQKRLKKTEKKLGQLKQKASETIERMKDTLKNHVEECVAKVRDLLEDNPSVQELVTSWSSSDLINQSDVHIVKKEVESEVCLRLQNFIMDWEQSEGHFKKAKEDLEEMFREELSGIEEAMSAIERNLTGQGDEDDTKQEDLSMAEVISTDTSSFGESVFDLSIVEKVLIGVTSPLWIPVGAVGALIAAPAMFFVSPKSIFKKLREMKAKRKFNDNKLEYLKKQGLRVLEKFKERETLRAYVVNQMRPSYIFIDSCEQSISEAIESNLILVEHLKEDVRSVEKVRQDVGSLQKKVKIIHDMLTIFGLRHVKELDYDEEQVSVQDAIVSGGAFSNIVKGQLQQKKKATSRDMLIKVSKERSDAAILRIVSEEKCLRRVRHPTQESAIHPNIIWMLGAAKGPGGIPMLILEPASRSLRSLLGRRKSIVTSDNVRRALLDVGKGLEYLHKKGMVHIELSMDTVLVTTEGRPKLTSPCEPRRPELPETADAPASPYVYLAPEVLRGGIYKKPADMYSVGLMMWEMWSLKRLSEVDKIARLKLNQIQDGADKFIRMPAQSEVLPTIAWRPLMSACLDDDPRNRQTCTEFMDVLKDDQVAEVE
ncbi:CSK [Branchiostoma lanceolatum]|uniref:CSK protein n=1 Tax=Branchiostoma lanceolatum TaxID=7740 RepID=A0A8J9VXJ8_BRALA|nr:CSK [Branchiostoma lanceolatum]